MSHEEPSLKLNMEGGHSFEATPRNTTLYTFLGKTSIGDLEVDNTTVNHVFLQTGSNEQGQGIGMYFFRSHPVYRELSAFMTENQYPMILNRRDVPACDLKAYFEEVDRQTEMFASQIPDEL